MKLASTMLFVTCFITMFMLISAQTSTGSNGSNGSNTSTAVRTCARLAFINSNLIVPGSAYSLPTVTVSASNVLGATSFALGTTSSIQCSAANTALIYISRATNSNTITETPFSTANTAVLTSTCVADG